MQRMWTVVGVATKRRSESKERKRTGFRCPVRPVIWTCPLPLEEQAVEMTRPTLRKVPPMLIPESPYAIGLSGCIATRRTKLLNQP
jgi:hypothetical protein